MAKRNLVRYIAPDGHSVTYYYCPCNTPKAAVKVAEGIYELQATYCEVCLGGKLHATSTWHGGRRPSLSERDGDWS